MKDGAGDEICLAMQRRVSRRRKFLRVSRCRVEARASARPPVRSAHLDRARSTAHPTDQGLKAMMEPWNCQVTAHSDAGIPLPSLTGLSVPGDRGNRPALSDIATHSTALGIQSKPEEAATIPAYRKAVLASASVRLRFKPRAASPSQNLTRRPTPPAGKKRYRMAVLNCVRFD